MALKVVRAGVQATLQASAREGTRHLGVPASGPADPLSMALANRLVGNPADACALEMPFGLAAFDLETDCALALAGAPASITLGGRNVEMHRTLDGRAGGRLSVGPAEVGARIYLAIAGGFSGDDFLGSRSTCLPAGFGGYIGRAVGAGDRLEAATTPEFPETLETPASMRQTFSHSFALRCVPGPDAHLIPEFSSAQEFSATRRADRTGIEVSGPWPKPDNAALKPSAPVFPGTIQLTPSGNAFILLPDAQTTGGYPHVFQVIRADQHLLGQVRPGDRLHLLKRTSDEAAEDLRRKTGWFRGWLPDLRF